MKISELLEALKEKSVDDLSVNPGSRVGRIIKQMTAGKKFPFELSQNISQPKKAGDAIVNIEVHVPQNARADISKLVMGDEDDDGNDPLRQALRDKIKARTKEKDVGAAQKEFMVTLFKRVKSELSGLKEIGYKKDNEDKNKYVYVSAEEFDPEKLIKQWDRPIRFKFAFSSDVHSQKFDMAPEIQRVQKEFGPLVQKETGLQLAARQYENSIRFDAPKEFAKKYSALGVATNIYAKSKEWITAKKKIKELWPQMNSPLTLRLSGSEAYWGLAIEFQKPKASELAKFK